MFIRRILFKHSRKLRCTPEIGRTRRVKLVEALKGREYREFSILGSLLLTTFLFVVFSSPAISQGTDNNFDQTYSEYTKKVEEYKRTRDEYVLARSQYLKFKTLTAQNNAKEATKRMLEARDNVVVLYLQSIKAKVNETKGIDDPTEEGLFIRLDEEISWFSDHKAKLSSAGTLDDLVSDSNLAKGRWKSAAPLIYESLAVISSGKINDFQERLTNIFNGVKGKMNEIGKEEREEYKFSSRKIQIIDRWIFETENRITRSEGKQTEALEIISEYAGGKKNEAKLFEDALIILDEAKQYSKEGSSFLKEIIREIKTAE